jgi:hypothetical protein
LAGRTNSTQTSGCLEHDSEYGFQLLLLVGPRVKILTLTDILQALNTPNIYSNISAFSGILWNTILREVFQYRIPWNTVFYGIPYSMKCGILVEISIPWSTVTVLFTREPTLLYSEEY